MEPDDQPRKLDYAPAEHTNVLGPTLLVFGGGILGAAVIAFIGLVIGLMSYSAQANQPHAGWSIAPIVIFGVILVAAIAASILVIRRPRREWFVIGLLLGAGVTSLIEGICFANS